MNMANFEAFFLVINLIFLKSDAFNSIELKYVGKWFHKENSIKVVVTFYLRLRNEFQPFPAKNQASYRLTYWDS